MGLATETAMAAPVSWLVFHQTRGHSLEDIIAGSRGEMPLRTQFNQPVKPPNRGFVLQRVDQKTARSFRTLLTCYEICQS